MCLFNDPNDVKDFLKKNRKRKTITVYKRLNKVTTREGEYPAVKYTTILRAPYMETEYKPGVIQSSSRRSKPCEKYDSIGPGIHCYLSLDKAERTLAFGGHQIIATMTVNVKDVLGVSYDVAVFKSAKLSKKEYERHVK